MDVYSTALSKLVYLRSIVACKYHIAENMLFLCEKFCIADAHPY